ncbi:MAG: glycosyl hydrolase family 98 [Prevotella sp.]|nr:glycosyl hydrolase family 98 [Prevotella sp.]
MFRKIYQLLLALLLLTTAQTVSAQQRRPIDNQHPLWLVHIDVWNSADPQKIINLIPEDIRPFVCMNLSLSCQYDKDTNMYRMPRCAVRTYESWATVCQLNGMWFTCQPASGGHTHIQDDDMETFEYFFKTYPNFLGWNYAEQFWGFDESDDESSSNQPSRIALFAKLVEMHHNYGGMLTISFCGNIWSHGLNPMGMMKRNSKLLQACKDYPEACLWLYKYTTSSCWYANESVTFGPFVSGLAKNYGVRYDNCGWNGALDAVLGSNHGKKYPGAAGIGTVMEQTCVNGGAVWDGPELIWTEDFQNLSNTTVDGFTRRNWGMFNNFKGVWLDMFRQVINGAMYIPTREEVVGNIKIAIQNDMSSGSDEDKYAAWGSLYDGLYKQTDPFNRGNGQWMDNLCYFKKTGRYGTIPLVIGYYDEVAKGIPTKLKKSSFKNTTQTKKVNDFNNLYPEVSKGDLYVNRYKNQLVTYTPYSYLNAKKGASASIPLQYNTCDTLKLAYGKLSSAYIREYADHINFYLNNYRSDSTTAQVDTIVVVGVTQTPSVSQKRHNTGAGGMSMNVTKRYDEENQTFTIFVKHMGGVDLTINCTGDKEREEALDMVPEQALEMPQQPEPYVGPVIIEAENMDYKDVSSVALTHSGWWATDMQEFAGMGYVVLGTKTSAALRHQLTLNQGGEYDIYVRYCNTSKAGNIKATVNGTDYQVAIQRAGKNNWQKAKFTANLNGGQNDLVLTNTGSINMIIDQIIYVPAGSQPVKRLITIREADNGRVVSDVTEAAEGETVHLTVYPDEGYGLNELRLVNSVYYTMGKTIAFAKNATEVTFTMPDENMTIQPFFSDNVSAYSLDFTNVNNGAMPEGWQATDNTDIHEYPNSYSQGPRTMAGFTGWQGKGLYWRNTSAEYGRQSAYPLSLEPGSYKLEFAMAAWKGTPQYKGRIISPKNTVLATTQALSATPNANGNSAANLTSASLVELPFEVTEGGKHIISFIDNGTGFDEFLLLACRVIPVNTSGIASLHHESSTLPAGIYSLSGTRRQSLQSGMNIIVTTSGEVRKVMVK